jgi:hypothetical protein
MPTPTYTPLANVTLGTAAASVTFSSIPATYRDLIVVVAPIMTTNDVGFNIRFNSDTGANYSYVLARGLANVTPVQSQSYSSQTEIFGAGFSLGQGTSSPTTVLLNVMDYSATDKHKTILNRFGTRRDNGDSEVGMLAGRWSNTAAISTILLVTGSSTFAANTTVSLYGVIA